MVSLLIPKPKSNRFLTVFFVYPCPRRAPWHLIALFLKLESGAVTRGLNVYYQGSPQLEASTVIIGFIQRAFLLAILGSFFVFVPIDSERNETNASAREKARVRNFSSALPARGRRAARGLGEN